MMKTRILSLAILVTLFLVGCEEEVVKPTATGEKEAVVNSKGVIVLKGRDPNSPLILSKRRDFREGFKTKSGKKPFYSYLGRSLKIEELPLTDYRNFGWKVLDMDRFVKDYPKCYFEDRIGTSNNYAFGYTNFSRYVEKSKISKKCLAVFLLI